MIHFDLFLLRSISDNTFEWSYKEEHTWVSPRYCCQVCLNISRGSCLQAVRAYVKRIPTNLLRLLKGVERPRRKALSVEYRPEVLIFFGYHTEILDKCNLLKNVVSPDLRYLPKRYHLICYCQETKQYLFLKYFPIVAEIWGWDRQGSHNGCPPILA